MPGLKPGTSRLSTLSECVYHLRYIVANPSAHTHSISGTEPSGHNLDTFQIFLFNQMYFRQITTGYRKWAQRYIADCGLQPATQVYFTFLCINLFKFLYSNYFNYYCSYLRLTVLVNGMVFFSGRWNQTSEAV